MMVMMTVIHVVLIRITSGITSLNFVMQPQTDVAMFSEIPTQPTSPRKGQYGYTTRW